MSIKANLAPKHPGEVLAELYLSPLGMSAGKLAKKLLVPRTRIERLLKGQTGVTSDTALRLGRFFNSTPEMWMNMQTAWDVAQERANAAADIEEIEPLAVEAA